MVQVAILSDLHVRADPTATVYDVDPAAALRDSLALLPRPPDVLVLPGDVADDGSRAAYDRVDALTAEVAPRRFVLPGNHDDPATMTEVFGDVEDVRLEPLSPAWSLALVDTSDPGRIGGHASAASIARLDALLDEAATEHTLVVLHHPVEAPCGYRECTFDGAEDLAGVLAHRRVDLVVSGHLHEQFDRAEDGVRHFGVVSTLRPLLHTDDELHWRVGDGPVGGALLELRPDGDCRIQPLLR